MEEKYKSFSHRECEYFPCHKGIPEDDFNCLFCYCPLYLLGSKCGGKFKYSASGRKDCSDCTIPHHISNYDLMSKRINDAAEKVREEKGEK